MSATILSDYSTSLSKVTNVWGGNPVGAILAITTPLCPIQPRHGNPIHAQPPIFHGSTADDIKWNQKDKTKNSNQNHLK